MTIFTYAADPKTACPDCGTDEYFVLHGPTKAGEFEVGCAECGVTFYVSRAEVEELPPVTTSTSVRDLDEDWVLNMRGAW